MDGSLPGSAVFLQGIFPSQGPSPGLQHCRQILYLLSHQGSPHSYNNYHKIKSLRKCTHTKIPNHPNPSNDLGPETPVAFPPIPALFPQEPFIPRGLLNTDTLLSLSSFAAYISGNTMQRGLLCYFLSRHFVYFCHILITISNHITEVICVNVYFISGCGWQGHKALVTKMFSTFPDQNTPWRKKASKQKISKIVAICILESEGPSYIKWSYKSIKQTSLWEKQLWLLLCPLSLNNAWRVHSHVLMKHLGNVG